MTRVANILFPADHFDKGRPDPAMRSEYEAALAEARLDVDTFDLERFECDGRVVLGRGFSDPSLPLVYRGWMMKPADYQAFHRELRQLGLSPLTSPSEYAAFHQFPLIYASSEHVRALSPKTLAFPDGRLDAELINESFTRFMAKDYVKSVKGTSFPTCIETPITQGEADCLAEEFVRLRGGLLTGGLVCKEYVELARYGKASNEWRAFYLHGELLCVCPNSCQPSACPKPPDSLVRGLERLGSPYYTVDFAERAEGGWMLVETGDGQVSGLAASQDPVVYFAVLADAFGRERFDARGEQGVHEEIVPLEAAYSYLMAGGDFACVKRHDQVVRLLLDDGEYACWHRKKIEHLQRYDDRYELGCTLAESARYIIHGEFEEALLAFKGTCWEDVFIGDFYGDPHGAAISPDERTCVVYGCGAVVYALKRPFEGYCRDGDSSQWFEIGRHAGDTLWIRHARYRDARTIVFALDGGKELVVDVAAEMPRWFDRA